MKDTVLAFDCDLGRAKIEEHLLVFKTEIRHPLSVCYCGQLRASVFSLCDSIPTTTLNSNATIRVVEVRKDTM